MKSIAFVIPWVGRLPNYFPLWLQTCKNNPSVDFILFTDDNVQYNYPDNVKVYYLSFKELKKIFQSKFTFKLALEHPYKFCDFKPAYGDVFSEYLEGYDFWGHCDIDLIFGDIRNFITEDILNTYDKIYSRGHCSIYRNTNDINLWYKTLPNYGYQKWYEVFQTPVSCCYDEWGGHCGGGISYIINANGITTYNKTDMADLDVSKGYFKVHNKNQYKSKRLYFHYIKGKLYVCSGEEKFDEIIYCHFQKRQVLYDYHGIDNNNFYIIAPGYITSNQSEIKIKRYMECKFKINYLINKVKKKMLI